MKTNFKKYITALLVTPLLFSSCSDDFLNEVDPNKETPNTFWVNEQNVNKGLAAVYNHVRRMTYGYYGGYEGILHYQMRADDMYPTRSEETNIWETLSFTNTPNTGNGCWGYLYKGIQAANEFLEKAPNASMDQAKLNQMLGEAYFLRGYWHFRVRTDFNEGVLRNHSQDTDPEMHGLSSPDVLLDQVIADMKEAKARLPKTRPAEEAGRITQGAAIAVLGKAYIWKGDYAAAKAELETIMSGYGYDLTDKYEDNFRDDTEFNKESIWEINFEAFGNEKDAWGSSTGDNAFMGSVIGHYFGPCFKAWKDPNKGDDEQWYPKGFGGGWYKMQPSPYLIKQFISEPRPTGADTKWDKRLYTTTFFKYSDYGDVIEDEKAFGIIPFDSLFYWTTDLSKEEKWRIDKGIPNYPDINGKPGRFLMKKLCAWWNPMGNSMYENNGGRITNYRIMRFAEVLFLHAEACLQTGDNTGAMKDINRIRVRAGLPEKQLGDKTAIMEELRKQKLLEFAGENIRWDDLVRWYSYEELKKIMHERKTDTRETEFEKDDKNKIIRWNYTGNIIDSQNFQRFEKKHMYFPIPQSEVDANLNLEQKSEWQ